MDGMIQAPECAGDRLFPVLFQTLRDVRENYRSIVDNCPDDQREAESARHHSMMSLVEDLICEGPITSTSDAAIVIETLRSLATQDRLGDQQAKAALQRLSEFFGATQLPPAP